MELLYDILSVIAYVLITGCGVVIVKKLLDFGNAKIDELQTNTKLSEYTQLNVLIDQAQSVVTTIVQSINQTFVNKLKESGEFTAEAATEAKEAALKLAHELISDEIANAITTVYGDLNKYLDALVEQLVNKYKIQSK